MDQRTSTEWFIHTIRDDEIELRRSEYCILAIEFTQHRSKQVCPRRCTRKYRTHGDEERDVWIESLAV